MAETIGFNLAKLVVDKLSSVILEEVKLVLGVEDELDRMKSNFRCILAVLQDAEKQQDTNESVNNWLRNLQGCMYDIDDLLDEITTEFAIRKKNKDHWHKQVRKFFSRTNFLVLRPLWAHQIKNVCTKLDQIAQERRDFMFSEKSVDFSESYSRETHSKVNMSEILGRDHDKEAVMNSLLKCGDCDNISVVPIVGFGGIGKTTLAKLVYHDNRIDDKFHPKLWVYVSEKFNIKKILKQIISILTGENLVQLTIEQLTLEELRIRISNALEDKKYFLVLDDVWNDDLNEWRRLKELLDVGARGSMVVVTTRDLKVASMVKTMDEYKLSELSNETCLQIFKQLAFKDCEKIKPIFLDLAKKIIEKSRGLPLLVTILGNLLHGKTDEGEWNFIIQKLEQGHEDIMNILKLSYEQLSSSLKLCFRFYSVYEKGTDMDPLNLSYLWMALGFLPNNDQDVGRRCINELLSKSLFQTAEDDLPLVDEHHNILMHDLMFDLAKSMAGDELAIINCIKKEVCENIRYMRLDEDYLSEKQYDKRLLNKAKKARLLMLNISEHPLSKSFLKSIISNLKCLRVLDLENSQFVELPRTIGYMKHLRYLSLQGNMSIKLLPDSICNLLNLQTLLLHGCGNLQKIPDDIGRLENLKALTLTIQQEALPESIGLLRALHLLCVIKCPKLRFLPPTTKQLENLDSLSIVGCDELDFSHGLCSLEGLNNLRTLSIKGLAKFQKLPMGVRGLPFTSLKHLAIFDCNGLTELTDWIECLTSLRALQIDDCPNLVGSPHTFSMLKSLEKLLIEGCPLLSERCAPMRFHDWHLISSTLELVMIDGKRIV